jgi:mono/diheme cytochrome c family protein
MSSRQHVWVLSGAILSSAWAHAFATAPRSEPEAGAALFAQKCAACHGSHLEGGRGPALAGQAFADEWSDRPLRKLYSRILTSMPEDSPGSLRPEETVELVKYIAAKNAVNVSANSPDDLNTIKFTPSK